MSAGAYDPDLKVNSSLDVLAPKFRQAVEDALNECNGGGNGGLKAKVYESYRSQDLQALYYARGRTVIPPNSTVTNAPTNLYSWHGYGLAVDVVHADDYWTPPGGEAWFAQVAVIFKKHSCKWGGDWKKPDTPHFQWAQCMASPSDAARQLLATKGVKAVWDAVGAS